MGLRKNPEDYRLIRDVLLRLGHSIYRDWLDEHKKVGLDNLFSENEKSIIKSDAVILEATHDIHGVGIQIALAIIYKRPILLLKKSAASSSISELFLIDKQDRSIIHSAEYSAKNLESALARFLKWVEDNPKLARFNIELDRKLDNYLRLRAKMNDTSKAEEIRKLIEQDLNNYR